MVEAQVTSSSTETQSPQFLKVAQSVATQADFASRLVRFWSGVSLGGVLFFWLLCFAGYALDSFKAAVACAFALLALLAPPWFLYKLHRSLHILSTLPNRVRQVGPVDIQGFRDAIRMKDDAEPGLAQRVWTRIEVLLHLRGQLVTFEDELRQIPVTGRVVGFLVHPIIAVLAVLSSVITLFLYVGAVLAAVASMLAYLFT